MADVEFDDFRNGRYGCDVVVVEAVSRVYFETEGFGESRAGTQPFELPEKIGIKLKPEQVIVVQMHYHPVGGPQEDSSTVQLRFTEDEPEHELYVLFPGNAEDEEEVDEERADRPPVETVTVVSASRTRWR